MKGPRAALVAMLAFVSTAHAEVPAWLSGTPDTDRHDDLMPLYAAVFEDVARRCDIRAESGSFARERLVAAVNAAVDDWRRTRREAYAAYLPWLVIAEPGPRHCDFRLRGELIGRVLAKTPGG